MSKVFKKMNLKEGTDEILVLNAPESFESEIEQLSGVNIRRSATDLEKLRYGVAFAITRADLDTVSEAMASRAEGDALLWLAYPKKSSRKYTCEFNRDTGWDVLGSHGFEPVRMVAIDADWSALRFRHIDFIKSMKRSKKMAISKEGKKRTN